PGMLIHLTSAGSETGAPVHGEGGRSLRLDRSGIQQTLCKTAQVWFNLSPMSIRVKGQRTKQSWHASLAGWGLAAWCSLCLGASDDAQHWAFQPAPRVVPPL